MLEEYYKFTKDWMTGCFRVLKESGSMYVFSGWNNLKDILNSLDDVGFTTINHIIWKYQFGVVTNRKFVTSNLRFGAYLTFDALLFPDLYIPCEGLYVYFYFIYMNC